MTRSRATAPPRGLRVRHETLVQAIVAAVTFVSLAGFVWFFGADARTASTLLLQRASIVGLAVYVAYSLCVLALLGGGWLAASGEGVGLLGTFVWARIVRDAAADLLPFSQLGAIVIGFRIVLRRGVESSVVYASFIADLTTELVSQLLFTVFGVTILATRGFARVDASAGVLVAMCAIAALAIAAASAGWTLPLASRLVAVALPGAGTAIARTSAMLTVLYRRRDRITVAFLVNVVGWVASAGGAYLGLRLLGVEVGLWQVLALESLIFAVRSVAFAVPGGLGVQEAAYGVFGPLLGVPAEAAVLIAILKRARDVAIGLPVLATWQVSQIGRLTVRA